MEDVLKALTIWQPWASMLGCGAKLYETRGWATKYRGPVAIHAAMKDPCKLPLLGREALERAVREEIDAGRCPEWRFMPRGKIIAIADLVNVWHIVYNVGRHVEEVRKNPVFAESMSQNKHDPDFYDTFVPSKKELALGDWTPGRYAWEFANVRMLPNPIPVKGQQGLWTYHGSLSLPAQAAEVLL